MSCFQCRQEYKIPALYVIDSVIRQSRHQVMVGLNILIEEIFVIKSSNVCVCVYCDRYLQKACVVGFILCKLLCEFYHTSPRFHLFTRAQYTTSLPLPAYLCLTSCNSNNINELKFCSGHVVILQYAS